MPGTSTSPPSPTKTGSGAFIVAAVVMLALMGGLIFWKLRGGEAPEPPQTPKPVATKQPEPTLETPPPPPPPLEPEPAKPQRKVIKRPQAGGGCGGQCTGTAPAALHAALMAKAGQARGCYERALRLNSTLQGHMVLNVRVGPQGEVCSASVASDGLRDPGVASCVTKMFLSAVLPPAQGGCVDTEVPMNFIPKT